MSDVGFGETCFTYARMAGMVRLEIRTPEVVYGRVRECDDGIDGLRGHGQLKKATSEHEHDNDKRPSKADEQGSLD